MDYSKLSDNLFLIAGPCVIESEELLHTVAQKLVEIKEKSGVEIIFKSSYDKANRTSINGFRGPGLEKGVEMLVSIREKYGLPVLTDVHSAEEASYAGKHLDILQIPAFLCRQTELLLSAAETNAIVNVKKGQFLAPWDMKPLVEKLKSKTDKILLTERGSSFGYNMLVNDMRSIPTMQDIGYPVVYDGTHSVQMPGGQGNSTGGDRTQVPVLSRAAVAAGASGLFWETHPDPDNAKSDGPNMLFLNDIEKLLSECISIYNIVRSK
jgi:2-dehydro-3-deoxyphosphooctonate aldolase (KDO 8-P synthase)